MSNLDWVHRLLFELASFGVATLPEHVKQQDRLSPYATTRTHVLSGVLEFFAAVSFFVVAMVRYVVGFSNTQGYAAVSSMPTTDYGTFFGVGALAYLSFLITPQALLLVYCVAEGLVRAYETALTGRMLGMALVALPWRVVEHLLERSRKARLAVLLGPVRPDELLLPAHTRSGLLEIYSVEDKPWSDVQVVEYRGIFYILTGKRLVPRGGHHAYRYLLQETEDREVIRGNVVHLEAAETLGEQGRRSVRPPLTVQERRGEPRSEPPREFAPPDRETFVSVRRVVNTQQAPEGSPPRGDGTSND
jgi:hypothetical protein